MKKHIEEISELKNVKTQKFGGFIKKTLEEQIRYLERIKTKEKNKEKFEREVKQLREKINDLIDNQCDDKRIAQDNLEILKSNIEVETKNISICDKNKEYLTELYSRLNDIG